MSLEIKSQAQYWAVRLTHNPVLVVTVSAAQSHTVCHVTGLADE